MVLTVPAKTVAKGKASPPVPKSWMSDSPLSSPTKKPSPMKKAASPPTSPKSASPSPAKKGSPAKRPIATAARSTYGEAMGSGDIEGPLAIVDIKPCSLCKVKKPENLMTKPTASNKNTSICLECGAAYSRMKRCLKMHPSIEKDELTMSSAVVQCQNLYGADLLAKVRSAYSQEKSDEQCSSGKTLGAFMDEVELKKKYKDNPTRADNIMKNSEQVWCKIGECKLYKDVSYNTLDVNSSTIKRTHTDMVDDINPRAVKGPKKLKVVKQPKALTNSGDDKPSTIPLTDKQEATLVKAVTELNDISKKVSKEIDPLQAEINKGDDAALWSTFVPSHIAKDVNLALGATQCLVAQIQLTISNKTTEVPKGFQDTLKSIKDTKDCLKDHIRSLKLQEGEAKKTAARAEAADK